MTQGTLSHLEALASNLLSEHGLLEWTFGWDRAVRRAGRCVYGSKRITVSRYFAEEASTIEFEQVVLHEIAHAIVGPGAGHGHQWRMTARRIGYVGGTTLGWEYAKDRAPWKGTCPVGHETVRFRRPKREVSCGRCRPTYDPDFRITWQRAT